MPGKRNPLDEIVDYASDKLVAEIADVPDDSPPFASVKLSQSEQVQRYLEMREKPEAWLKLLDERGLKEVVDYALKMEQFAKVGTSEEMPYNGE